MTMIATCEQIDESWGPWAQSCRGGFDFTLTFEDTILIILPSIIFIVASLIGVLCGRERRQLLHATPYLSTCKPSLHCVTIGLADIVVENSNSSPHQYRSGGYILRNSVSLSVVVVSIAPHRGRTQSVPQSLPFSNNHLSSGPDEAPSLAYRGTGNAFEGAAKRALWSGPIPLASAYTVGCDLFGMYDAATAGHYNTRFGQYSRLSQVQGSKATSLLRALFLTLRIELLIPALPRGVMIAVTLVQPLLLQRILDFVQGEGYSERMSVGYGLIGACALLYGLTSMFNAWYAHASNRLALQIRNVLVDAIYSKLLRLPIAKADPGLITTLINVDMEHIIEGARVIHDLWAAVISVGVSLYMIYWKLGLAPVNHDPVVSLQGSKDVGTCRPIYEGIEETKDRRSSPGTLIWSILSTVPASASSQIALVAAYGGFAIVSRTRDEVMTTDTMFTSLALLQISTDPLFMLIQETPLLVSAYKCIQRIQSFLEEHSSMQAKGTLSLQETVDAHGKDIFELNCKPLPDASVSLDGEECGTLIKFHNACYSGGNTEGEVLLSDLTLVIRQGSAVIVAGSIGSGKSSLLKAILGELCFVSGYSYVRPHLRMAYCAQEPWLLNDTIRNNILGGRAMDSGWYQQVLEAVHLLPDLDSLSERDSTIIGHGGSRLSGGQRQRISLARALYSRPQLLLADDILSGLDKKTEQGIIGAVFSPFGLLKRLECTVVLATHSDLCISKFDDVITMDQGRILFRGSSKKTSNIEEMIGNRNLGGNDNFENLKTASTPTESITVASVDSVARSLPDEDESAATAPSDWSIYLFFARSMSVTGFLVFVALAMAIGAERSFESVWLQDWAESKHPDHVAYYVGIFTGLVVGGLILLYITCWSVLITLRSILVTRLQPGFPNSVFFEFLMTSSSIGIYGDQFIQDIMLLDNDLPMAWLNTFTALCAALGETIIVLLSSKYLVISVPFLLRLMDIESKAPLSGFVNDTISGLLTVRAFGRIDEFQCQARQLLQTSQAANYMLLSIQVWLKMILDFIVMILAVAVTGLAVGLRSQRSVGFLGLALVNLISLSSTIRYVMTFWVDLETSIGAAARIRQFNISMTPEDDPSNRPEHKAGFANGNVAFQDVSAVNGTSGDMILKDVTFSVREGQKVAICGRTGSGKSALLGTLLRLLDIQRGVVTVGDEPITGFSRDSIRGSFLSLPQKPLLFANSVRYNMDPWGRHADSQDFDTYARESLQQVGIWEVFEQLYHQSLSDAGAHFPIPKSALDLDIDTDGSLTPGQQQLFCLARLLCRLRQESSKFPVILLDEVTSSVDQETERTMRCLLRNSLQKHTVLEVIHRLKKDAVREDYDLVLVLDQGQIVEFGPPAALLNTPGVSSSGSSLYIVDNLIDVRCSIALLLPDWREKRGLAQWMEKTEL
ncbi:P-loop containing nucleoside triphosphate hydrolase protein [Aspergillus niger ATCC 13496]|uniref:P-loop containing nucleoside triphosphate hydrolase protein n=1 Tax=Aspergillus niger ATCC 13496 TaxID=1353008 RepID=A0A370CEB2_ASPNG|nr:P-loop containing nucleoside triphosphate hydrolase protein [Aspergillus niger ATCC 13496]